MSEVTDILKSVFDLRYFHPEEDGTIAIPSLWVPGKSDLVLVLGPNAGGKSFFRRLVQETYRRRNDRKRKDEKKVEPIHLSMEGRVGSDGLGWKRVMVYGDEQRSSTGELSGHLIMTGINTSRGRDNKHFLYWDEPDIGMSNGVAAGAGIELREFWEDRPTNLVCVFITTHSRALVRQLQGLEPHYVHLGTESPPGSLEEWLEAEEEVLRPSEVKERARERFKRILAIIRSK